MGHMVLIALNVPFAIKSICVLQMLHNALLMTLHLSFKGLT